MKIPQPPLDHELAAKVEWLRQPQAYPERPDAVTAIETHMSWVFLSGRYAYKLKKPVRHDYLDFSTLQAREHYCHEELRLNMTLAPGVYLAVVPLTRSAAGQFDLEGAGEAVEWLVKMRRLDRDRMMDQIIRTYALREEQVRAIGEIVAAFYRDAPTVGMSAEDYCQRYADAVRLNGRLLTDPLFELPAHKIDFAHAVLLDFQSIAPSLLSARAAQVIEGHGDLRPEHVCLETTPVIFDRLEFNRDFRLIDPVDELSYLAMECARLGAAGVADILFEIYATRCGDPPPPALRHYYMAYRACLRARLSALHIRDRPKAAWPKWLTEAREYLQIAERHAREISYGIEP